MSSFDIMFYVIGAITLFSAATMVFSKNIIYNAIGLLFAFFGVAGIFVMLGADFLAATQLLIYVGGVLVLLLFGVMLSQRITGLEMRTGTLQIIPAAVVCVGVAAILLRMFWMTPWQKVETGAPQPTTKSIGTLFMTDYLIPFEIVSVLLLAALVGAAFIGRRDAR